MIASRSRVERLSRRAGLPTQPVCPGGCGGLQTVEQPFGSQEPRWVCPVCGSEPAILAIVKCPPQTAEQWDTPEARESFGSEYANRMIASLADR